jgi:hypothetical protein
MTRDSESFPRRYLELCSEATGFTSAVEIDPHLSG